MIDFIIVGKKIAHLRKQLNLTQDDLANKLYVSRQLVSKWENGIGTPSIETFVDMSKLFGVSIEEILCTNDKVEIDEENIFKGHERSYIINSIINGSIEVDITNVLYQMSSLERMLILKAIKSHKLNVKIEDLIPKLTISEQKFLEKEICKNDIKKRNN